MHAPPEEVGAVHEDTRPRWNCVDFPNDGMHYINRNGDCHWCGMARAEIKAERAAWPAASGMDDQALRDNGIRG